MRTSIAAAETSRRLAEKMQTLARTDVVTSLANRAGLNHDMVEMLMALDAERASWRCCGSISTGSRKSTTRSATRSATKCSPKSPGGSRAARPRAPAWPASAATSSSSSPKSAVAQRERAAGARGRRGDRPPDADRRRSGSTLGSSMGVALLPDDGPDIDTLMQGADLALYHAKVGGREPDPASSTPR